MDNEKLVSQLTSIIHQVQKFRNPKEIDAESQFLKQFSESFPDTIRPSTFPSIMKCCQLESCSFEEKVIDLTFDDWPTALVADGCGVNPKGGKKLVEDFGLLSPTTRCSGHAASRSIRSIVYIKNYVCGRGGHVR